MVFIKHSRGRPRLNRQESDKGTPELQQKREHLSGADPALAESLLGVLYARQLISRPLYEAGCFFGELGYRFKPCLGYAFRNRSHVLSVQFGRCTQERDSFLTEREEEKRTKAWRKALAVLQETGPASQKAVLNVIFCDQDLYKEAVCFPQTRDIKNLQKGLERLDLYFKGELRGTVNRQPDRGLILSQSTNLPQPLAMPPPPALLEPPGLEYHSP